MYSDNFVLRVAPRLFLMLPAFASPALHAAAGVTITPPYTLVVSAKVVHPRETQWKADCQAAYLAKLKVSNPANWSTLYQANKEAYCTEYVHKLYATVANATTGGVFNVKGAVTSTDPTVAILENILNFGDVEVGSPAVSANAFKIRTNGLVNPRTMTSLNWAVTYDPMPAFDSPAFPTNRWLQYSIHNPVTFAGAQHAGMAIDTRRGKLLVFGSETHSTNFDNSVYDYDIATRTWTTHYPQAGLDTYQLNEHYQPFAGDPAKPLPWAMHTYDEIVFVPDRVADNDKLIVVAADGHNYPAYQKFATQINANLVKFPTWIYDLKTQAWSTFLNTGAADPYAVPVFFAAGSAYDPDRNVIWAAKDFQLSYINADRTAWTTVAGAGANLGIHFNLDYDTKRHKLFVFGGYNLTQTIWTYTLGLNPAVKGTWTATKPSGNCPADDQQPVAFDQDQGVFLLRLNQGSIYDNSQTYVYDPDTNRCLRIPNAGIVRAPGGKDNDVLDYKLAYDPVRKVFFAVKALYSGQTVVWVFKLDYPKLLASLP